MSVCVKERNMANFYMCEYAKWFKERALRGHIHKWVKWRGINNEYKTTWLCLYVCVCDSACIRVICESLCVNGKVGDINNTATLCVCGWVCVNHQFRVVKVCLFMQWPTYAPQKGLIKSLIVLLLSFPSPPSPCPSVLPPSSSLSLPHSITLSISLGVFLYAGLDSLRQSPLPLSRLPEPRGKVKPWLQHMLSNTQQKQ